MPRSMFAHDGKVLIADKASVMHAIEAQPSQPPPSDPVQQPSQLLYSDPVQYPTPSTYILDAMAVLQTMKKTPGMNKIINLKHAIINTIKNRTHKGGYTEVRVLFDQYLPLSLKEKTRAERATTDEASSAVYEVHDEMSIRTVPLVLLQGQRAACKASGTGTSRGV